ncbi:MAG: exodeoxyribonuclease VII small subunit [Lachnospiraceae bacterium]|nr:exodeoxyribonuclease VII small subunit [Lachnospiraceae bacterium]
MAEKENKSIEEKFNELEEVLKAMDSQDVGLMESFELYNKGLLMVKDLNEQLDEIEQKIEIVNE